MRAPADNILTAWASGGTVHVLAFGESADGLGGRTGGEPLTHDEVETLHKAYLADLLAAARRRDLKTVDVLKRFETDLRVAVEDASKWRRASR